MLLPASCRSFRFGSIALDVTSCFGSTEIFRGILQLDAGDHK